jgi:hypothetical protein
MLAKWQRQEDATHAKEADVQCHHDEFFRTITNGFAINLDSLVVNTVSWDSADNTMALLAR